MPFGADGELHVFDAAQFGGVFALQVTVQPRFSAYRMYMRSRSPANNAASSPPVPALISMIVSRASSGSRGINAVQFLLNCRQLALQTFRFFREIRIFGSHFLAGRLQIVFHLLVCGVCGNDDAQPA